MILKLCKGVHCVNLVKRFRTHIYLQNLASIQPRTSPLEFAASRDTLPRQRSPGRREAARTLGPELRTIASSGVAGLTGAAGAGAWALSSFSFLLFLFLFLFPPLFLDLISDLPKMCQISTGVGFDTAVNDPSKK